MRRDYGKHVIIKCQSSGDLNNLCSLKKVLEDLNQERLQLVKEHRLEGSQLEDLDSQLDEIIKVCDHHLRIYVCVAKVYSSWGLKRHVTQ